MGGRMMVWSRRMRATLAVVVAAAGLAPAVACRTTCVMYLLFVVELKIEWNSFVYRRVPFAWHWMEVIYMIKSNRNSIIAQTAAAHITQKTLLYVCKGVLLCPPRV